MTETTPPSTGNPDRPTVLIAEDERELADLYAAWLGGSYTVKTAYDGEEALDELDESVDVALLDRRMPGPSGDEVLEHIRSEGLDIRVAIVSAVTPDFDVIGMGFDEYLIKPVDADELHAAVDRLLARAEYDEAVQRFQQVRATQAVLDTSKRTAELRESDEYAALQERMAELQADIDTPANGITDEDLEAAFRELGRATTTPPNEEDASDGDAP